MPTFKGISICLQSQYDAATIPEQVQHSLVQLSQSQLPNASISSLDLSGAQTQAGNPLASVFPLDRSGTIDVDIPIFPSSQFWISYACSPPLSAAGASKDEVRYFYFKLLVNERCILSWGVGEDESWSGKTMHAFFNAGTDFNGRKIVEKRGLFFPKHYHATEEAKQFEIRVFRAKARKRETLKCEGFKTAGSGGAFDLTSLGHVKKGERQRMYTYALVDAKDEPYATFRYILPINCNDENLSDLASLATPRQISHTMTSKPAYPTESLPRPKSVPSRKDRSKPISPIKKSPTSPRIDLPEIKSRKKDWVTRTPSPMVSRLLDAPSTPTPGPKSGPREKLKNKVTSPFRKREDKDGFLGPWL